MTELEKYIEEKKKTIKVPFKCRIGWHNHVLGTSFEKEELPENNHRLWVVMICPRCLDKIRIGMAYDSTMKEGK